MKYLLTLILLVCACARGQQQQIVIIAGQGIKVVRAGNIYTISTNGIGGGGGSFNNMSTNLQAYSEHASGNWTKVIGDGGGAAGNLFEVLDDGQAHSYFSIDDASGTLHCWTVQQFVGDNNQQWGSDSFGGYTWNDATPTQLMRLQGTNGTLSFLNGIASMTFPGAGAEIQFNNGSGILAHMLFSGEPIFQVPGAIQANGNTLDLPFGSGGFQLCNGNMYGSPAGDLACASHLSTNGFTSLAGRGAAPTAITVGASPFAYTYSGTNNATVYVNNPVGVGSNVKLNGTTLFAGTATVQITATVNVQPGDVVTVTYTSTPLMSFKPL